MAALIRATFRVNPWDLKESEFVSLAHEVIYLKMLEKQTQVAAMKEALTEILTNYFPSR